MFLSKRSNGVYYLWYYDEGGKKRKLSTKTHSKPEAQSKKRQMRKYKIKDDKGTLVDTNTGEIFNKPEDEGIVH